jgi:predicted transposase YbfD/YdcC
VFRLTRERTVKGKTTVEVVYGITSLAPELADAARLLGLVRGHWGIENRLHYIRDVTLGEDACRVRSGSAPQILAGLRNAAMHLLKKLNPTNTAAATRHLNAKPRKAIKLIQSRPEN